MIEVSAALLRIEFLLGLAKTSDVIAWADNAMATIDNPSNELMDLSMASNESATTIASLLSKISGETVDASIAEAAFRAFAAKVWDKLEAKTVTSDAVAKELYAAGTRSNLTLPADITSFCGSIDDAFSKDRAAAEKALRGFLVKMKAPPEKAGA